MSELALVAEFQVEAQGLELFLAAAKREMRAVRTREPGCLGFDVILFDEGTGEGAFVEVFRDQAAVDAHRETPHFSAFFDEIADLAVTWTVRRGTAVSLD